MIPVGRGARDKSRQGRHVGRCASVFNLSCSLFTLCIMESDKFKDRGDALARSPPALPSPTPPLSRFPAPNIPHLHLACKDVALSASIPAQHQHPYSPANNNNTHAHMHSTSTSPPRPPPHPSAGVPARSISIAVLFSSLSVRASGCSGRSRATGARTRSTGRSIGRNIGPSSMRWEMTHP